jgi:flagellar biosynthesis protein FlhF
MRLKSYFAGTIEAALDQARCELGPEAMLVDSRRTHPEAKHLGEYEVVVASCPAPEPSGASHPEDGPLVREMAGLRKQMEELKSLLWRASMAAPSSPARTEPSWLASMLVDADVEPQLAREIAGAALARSCGGIDPEEALGSELGSRLAADTGFDGGEEGPRVVALVGPPGSGKTTTLVKLAVVYGLARRHSVHLLSADTWRIAAAEQLRTYAAILGVGLQVTESAWALTQALEEHRRKDLILIDTPGLAAADMDQAVELAACLSGRPEIDIHLVLPASTRSDDLSSAVERFEIFKPTKLLFTKIDEAGALGHIFSLAVRRGTPISFLTTGQQIPEDLEAAVRERIVGRIMQPMPGAALAAA